MLGDLIEAMDRVPRPPAMFDELFIKPRFVSQILAMLVFRGQGCGASGPQCRCEARIFRDFGLRSFDGTCLEQTCRDLIEIDGMARSSVVYSIPACPLESWQIRGQSDEGKPSP